MTAGSGRMFDEIARRYDLVNRIASLGLDQRWRRVTVRALGISAGQRVLDLATGTGDLAIAIARSHPGAVVVGLDPSRGMLAIAGEKAAGEGLRDRIAFEVGIAEDLPFAGASFDAASMAFGIRNVPDRQRALREIARVLRPGGRVAILELGEPRSLAARVHVHAIVPRIGGLLSRADPYRYLSRSIAAFPPPDAFAALLAGAGLRTIRITPLSFGASVLFLAERPERACS